MKYYHQTATVVVTMNTARTLFPDVEPSKMTRYNNHGKCTVPTVIEITDTAGYVLPHYIHSRSVT